MFRPTETKLCQKAASAQPGLAIPISQVISPILFLLYTIIGHCLGLYYTYTDRLNIEQGNKTGYLSLGRNSPNCFSTLPLADRAGK